MLSKNKCNASFLFHHRRAVADPVDGETSSHIVAESGVPKGSVLVHTLFLFYTNDMADGIKSTVWLFKDDTIAYITISSDKDPYDY